MKLERLVSKFRRLKKLVNMHIDSHDEELEELESRQREATENIETFKETLQTLEKENNRLINSLSLYSNRLTTIEQYKPIVDDLRQRGMKLVEQVSALEEHRRSSAFNAGTLKSDLEETQAKLEMAEGRIESLQLSLNNCIALISNLQEQLMVESSLPEEPRSMFDPPVAVTEAESKSHGFTATFFPKEVD
jgi:chromosome segregation ATPase